MSIGGPSALGTLLVHRLDSVLGTTLSQQANLVTGARPDAVTQPGSVERPDAAQNELHRQTRDGVDRATAQTEQQTRQAINRAKLDALAAEILAARSAPNTSTTKSAPTSLGHAARTILALLANHPDQPVAVQGKAPLLITNPRSALPSAAAGMNAATGHATRVDGAATAVRGQNINTPTAAAASATAATATNPSAASVPAQLAQALAQALQSSGIFYESHLNNLAYGKHSLTQLRQEPQAQVARGGQGPAPGSSPANAAPTSGGNTSAPFSAATADTLATSQGHRGEALASPTTGNTTTSAGSPNTSTPVPVPGLDPQTHQIVRQQLEVLANQTFAWRGEAWPDAPMEWEINRREPSRDDTLLSPETEHWATRINIQLPTLGNIQARLTLAGQQVVMQLIAPESSTLLKEHAEALRERYSAIGMQLSQIAVADNAWDAAASIVH